MGRNALIEFRRGTAAAWTSANPVLAAGEPGYETDTGKLKIGNGSTAWNTLTYIAPGLTSPLTTKGDIIIENATPALDRLPIGTTGQVLTVSSGLPAWQTPSASGTGLVQLFDSTLGADAATIDTGAGGVASGHGTLLIYVTARTDRAAQPTDTLFLRFNNDSGNNYWRNVVRNANTTLAGLQSGATPVSAIPLNTFGNTGPANAASACDFVVPAYDGTTFTKSCLARAALVSSTDANSESDAGGFTWNNTAAISRVAILSSTGANLRAGSRLQIYGVQ